MSKLSFDRQGAACRGFDPGKSGRPAVERLGSNPVFGEYGFSGDVASFLFPLFQIDVSRFRRRKTLAVGFEGGPLKIATLSYGISINETQFKPFSMFLVLF